MKKVFYFCDPVYFKHGTRKYRFKITGDWLYFLKADEDMKYLYNFHEAVDRGPCGKVRLVDYKFMFSFTMKKKDHYRISRIKDPTILDFSTEIIQRIKQHEK